MLEILRYSRHCKKHLVIFRLFQNMPRNDFLGLLFNCSVLVGNSSSGIIEASYFKIPVVNIGIRQKNREKGNNVIDIKNNSVLIYNTIKKLFNPKLKHIGKLSSIYGSGNTSKKIINFFKNSSSK